MSMRLFELIASPWAILPETYQQILEIYNAHLRGPKLDLSAFEKSLEATSGPKRTRVDGYSTIQSGVGILELFGPMAKRASGIARACTDMTGTAQAIESFQKLVGDPEVKAIILHIDSPGGAVDGTMDLARVVHAARGTKPIVAFADGLMASAAYWVGSACDSIRLANATTRIGSIGVVATHVDVSGAEAKEGVKTTEITAGKFKRVLSAYQPLTADGRATLQELVDDIYTLFVQDVSTFRNVPVEQVLERMAEGRVFMGAKALEVGLADGVSSLTELIAELAQKPAIRKTGAGRAPSRNATISQESTMALTRDELMATAEGQELIKSLIDEGKTQGLAQGLAQAKADADTTNAAVAKEAREAEQARVKGILETASGLEGHETLVQTMIADGTSPEQAAVKLLAAEKAAAPLRRIKSEAVPPVPFGGEPKGGEDKTTADLRARYDASPAIRSLYGSFENFEKASSTATTAAQNGRIRTK
jgi:signal peptide peptidase SppA